MGLDDLFSMSYSVGDGVELMYFPIVLPKSKSDVLLIVNNDPS
jgi:hypothetical protein